MTASMPWVKMFVDSLDDPRLLRLTEVCRWRWVQLELMAGECDAEGLLITASGPMSLDDIARRLRIKPSTFARQARSLETVGMLKHTAAGWQVLGFGERQGRKQSEKREQWKAAQAKARQEKPSAGPSWEPGTTAVLPQSHPTTTAVTPNSYPTSTLLVPQSYPENAKSAANPGGVINDGQERVEEEKSREEDKRMGADAPPTQAPAKGSKVKEPTPAAVEAFRAAAGFYPNKALWQSMSEAIGGESDDLAFWGQVVTGWIAKGWNPRNLSGMFDFYKKRELPGKPPVVLAASGANKWAGVMAWQESAGSEE